MRLALVESELGRKVVALEVTGEDRLVVLAAVVPPAELFRDLDLRLAVVVRHEVEKRDGLDSVEDLEPDVAAVVAEDGVRLQATGAELALDGLEVPGVSGIMAPGRRQDRFGSEI